MIEALLDFSLFMMAFETIISTDLDCKIIIVSTTLNIINSTSCEN
jgi:hypothetical protein